MTPNGCYTEFDLINYVSNHYSRYGNLEPTYNLIAHG